MRQTFDRRGAGHRNIAASCGKVNSELIPDRRFKKERERERAMNYNLYYVRFEGFTAVAMNSVSIWDIKNPVRTSQETRYVSTTEINRLMLWKNCGSHSGDYEECWRVLSSGMLRRVALVRTDDSEEQRNIREDDVLHCHRRENLKFYIWRILFSEFRRHVALVRTDVSEEPITSILLQPENGGDSSSETLVLTRATRCQMPEDDIPYIRYRLSVITWSGNTWHQEGKRHTHIIFLKK
jgi:hypothetical protein